MPRRPPQGKLGVRALAEILEVSDETLRVWNGKGVRCIDNGTAGPADAVRAAVYRRLQEVYAEEALGIYQRISPALVVEPVARPMVIVQGRRDASTAIAVSGEQLLSACARLEVSVVLDLQPTIVAVLEQFRGKESVRREARPGFELSGP